MPERSASFFEAPADMNAASKQLSSASLLSSKMQPFPEVRRALYDHEGKLKPFSDLYFESNLDLIFSALAREIFQFRLTRPQQLAKLFETREVLERFIDLLEFQRGHLERESAWHFAFVQLAGTRTGYASAIRKAALGSV